ncbi:hypothetical protein FGO68_gene10782 [Halteria grandinella]|uniref:Uncharacterized protein n=1 Tax=Halteria grandinella TaxID=5974 RepID=A0A8J8NIL6_HALGN|nr:hypothetical protein FGO68_gene10782 [Halteria grandinella]
MSKDAVAGIERASRNDTHSHVHMLKTQAVVTQSCNKAEAIKRRRNQVASPKRPFSHSLAKNSVSEWMGLL